MNSLNIDDFKNIFSEISTLMNDNKNYLCELDGVLGDGDIGVTMASGFSFVKKELQEKQSLGDFGQFFRTCGSVMSEKAPSTMGTLLGSGFIKASKSLKGKESLDQSDLVELFNQINDGIQSRGKAEIGDKTILDALTPAVKALEKEKNASIETMILEAYKAAEVGMKQTIEMQSNKGRGARYQENSKGKQDPGATVAKLIFEGFRIYINQHKAI
ncbi:dihydroxyacetone kinase subunit DhaL [Salibacterium aidingense]|uniref:dihydroxyacetone kinase subunit DhaL n=1 Tax=Salibacterium aidingense TaxID=384933 RepID=UPI000411810C|nr:dihydroxyacetone kinase subunit DhaL [Salibacterium aidingense]